MYVDIVISNAFNLNKHFFSCYIDELSKLSSILAWLLLLWESIQNGHDDSRERPYRLSESEAY